MKQIAKVLIIDNEDYHLLMIRANHPTLLNDPDLPGGIIEKGEEALNAALREVIEEACISLNPTDVQHLYTGSEYSAHGTEYNLYVARVTERPTVKMSWEHVSFEWITREEFLKQARGANDTYMHMVHDVVSNS